MMRKRSLLVSLFGIVLMLYPNQAVTTIDINEMRRNTWLVTIDELERLRMIACNRKLSRNKRAAAIVRLFRDYIKPGDNVQRFRSVFKNAMNWFDESRIRRITMLAGWIPMKFGPNTYSLELFPIDSGGRKWIIYFRLSGFDSGYGCHENDLEYASAFMKGRCYTTARIVDFVLCEYGEGDLFPEITYPNRERQK